LRRKILLILLIAFSFNYAQEIDHIYHLISEKIEADQKYLNVFAIKLPTDRLITIKNIPKFTKGNQPINFKNEEGISYFALFLGESVETDSIIVLSIYEEKDPSLSESDEMFATANSAIIYDTTQFLSFKDVQELYFSNRDFYNQFYKIIFEEIVMNDVEPDWLLQDGIQDESLMRSKGISGKNNQDYLNDVWVNSEHFYPKPIVQLKSGGRKSKTETSEYYLDANFSRITFYQSEYFALDSKKMNIIGLELTAEDKALNLLPWQSMTMAFGLRTFLSISDVVQNVYDDFLINAKILGRFRLNTSGFYKAPFIFNEQPKLNVTSGIILELNTTRAFGMPFLNFYYSGGVQNFSNPYVYFGHGDSTWSYFTTNQWFANMSFYWNTNELLYSRFKLDIGLGAYDVVKAINYNNSLTTKNSYYQIQPYLGFNFTFVPNKIELFSLQARYFDNVIKGNIWLKILEFSKIHTIRFQVNFISSPFFRNQFEWENDGGTSVQLNYRLGF